MVLQSTVRVNPTLGLVLRNPKPLSLHQLDASEPMRGYKGRRPRAIGVHPGSEKPPLNGKCFADHPPLKCLDTSLRVPKKSSHRQNQSDQHQ